ncbi:armadillo beta-catenin-like repeat protein [Cystoisospora suis]|uniref:Armadillo beta-catenin-like repeat protein n=1 Tax=Cystoisospora suis TaxID=483139 RepID=A0A2C6LA91_9APIC|nr:armadillo beta-catenin-like repeat protein [Cystoisospora suis]
MTTSFFGIPTSLSSGGGKSPSSRPPLSSTLPKDEGTPSQSLFSSSSSSTSSTQRISSSSSSLFSSVPSSSSSSSSLPPPGLFSSSPLFSLSSSSPGLSLFPAPSAQLPSSSSRPSSSRSSLFPTDSSSSSSSSSLSTSHLFTSSTAAALFPQKSQQSDFLLPREERLNVPSSSRLLQSEREGIFPRNLASSSSDPAGGRMIGVTRDISERGLFSSSPLPGASTSHVNERCGARGDMKAPRCQESKIGDETGIRMSSFFTFHEDLSPASISRGVCVCTLPKESGVCTPESPNVDHDDISSKTPGNKGPLLHSQQPAKVFSSFSLPPFSPSALSEDFLLSKFRQDDTSTFLSGEESLEKTDKDREKNKIRSALVSSPFSLREGLLYPQLSCSNSLSSCFSSYHFHSRENLLNTSDSHLPSSLLPQRDSPHSPMLHSSSPFSSFQGEGVTVVLGHQYTSYISRGEDLPCTVVELHIFFATHHHKEKKENLSSPSSSSYTVNVYILGCDVERQGPFFYLCLNASSSVVALLSDCVCAVASLSSVLETVMKRKKEEGGSSTEKGERKEEEERVFHVRGLKIMDGLEKECKIEAASFSSSSSLPFQDLKPPHGMKPPSSWKSSSSSFPREMKRCLFHPFSDTALLLLSYEEIADDGDERDRSSSSFSSFSFSSVKMNSTQDRRAKEEEEERKTEHEEAPGEEKGGKYGKGVVEEKEKKEDEERSRRRRRKIGVLRLFDVAESTDMPELQVILHSFKKKRRRSDSSSSSSSSVGRLEKFFYVEKPSSLSSSLLNEEEEESGCCRTTYSSSESEEEEEEMGNFPHDTEKLRSSSSFPVPVDLTLGCTPESEKCKRIVSDLNSLWVSLSVFIFFADASSSSPSPGLVCPVLPKRCPYLPSSLRCALRELRRYAALAIRDEQQGEEKKKKKEEEEERGRETMEEERASCGKSQDLETECEKKEKERKLASLLDMKYLQDEPLLLWLDELQKEGYHSKSLHARIHTKEEEEEEKGGRIAKNSFCSTVLPSPAFQEISLCFGSLSSSLETREREEDEDQEDSQKRSDQEEENGRERIGEEMKKKEDSRRCFPSFNCLSVSLVTSYPLPTLLTLTCTGQLQLWCSYQDILPRFSSPSFLSSKARRRRDLRKRREKEEQERLEFFLIREEQLPSFEREKENEKDLPPHNLPGHSAGVYTPETSCSKPSFTVDTKTEEDKKIKETRPSRNPFFSCILSPPSSSFSFASSLSPLFKKRRLVSSSGFPASHCNSKGEEDQEKVPLFRLVLTPQEVFLVEFLSTSRHSRGTGEATEPSSGGRRRRHSQDEEEDLFFQFTSPSLSISSLFKVHDHLSPNTGEGGESEGGFVFLSSASLYVHTDLAKRRKNEESLQEEEEDERCPSLHFSENVNPFSSFSSSSSYLEKDSLPFYQQEHSTPNVNSSPRSDRLSRSSLYLTCTCVVSHPSPLELRSSSSSLPQKVTSMKSNGTSPSSFFSPVYLFTVDIDSLLLGKLSSDGRGGGCERKISLKSLQGSQARKEEEEKEKKRSGRGEVVWTRTEVLKEEVNRLYRQHCMRMTKLKELRMKGKQSGDLALSQRTTRNVQKATADAAEFSLHLAAALQLTDLELLKSLKRHQSYIRRQAPVILARVSASLRLKLDEMREGNFLREYDQEKIMTRLQNLKEKNVSTN